MKRKLSFFIGSLSVFAVLLNIAACYSPGEYDYDKVIYLPTSSLTMYVGDEFQLKANPVSESFSWASENAGIASVTSAGLVKALAIGETNVTVSQNETQKKVPVTVVVPVAEKAGIAQKGRSGARINLEFATDKVKTVKVKHNNTNKDLNINLQSGVFHIDFDNIPDGHNVFTVVYVDNFGNESAPVNLSLIIVEPPNRSIRVATKFGNGLVIAWNDKAGDYCEVHYTDVNGNPKMYQAPVSENNTYIMDFKSDLSYSTKHVELEITSERKIFNYTDKSHTITSATPYIMLGRDFDLGGEGVGFHDETSQNQGGNKYRADVCGDVNSEGPDIEGGLNFGYTANGEWLMFTVNVVNAGTYTIDYNLSVNGGGAKATFEVNGVQLPMIDLENNNNWSDWKWYFGDRHPTMTPQSVYLPAGTNKLKFMCGSGSFNFMSFKFTYKP